MKRTLFNQLMKQRTKAYDQNLRNILDLLDTKPDAKILDLGCDDGKWTKKIAEKIQTNNVYGIDIVKEKVKKGRKLGIKISISNLNDPFPYKDNTFDVIHANQVIEHINDTDNFVSEAHRILKPEGYAIISTENLSSWHNVSALILGYMPFSLTNTSSKTAALGNPLAPHHNEDFWESSSWQHQRVFTKKGLDHLFSLHHFRILKICGAGYYPFGNFLANFDKIHTAFLTYKLIK